MIRVFEGPQAPPRPTLTLAGREAERSHAASLYDGVPTGWTPLRLLAEQAARVADAPVAAVNLVKATAQRTVVMIGGEATVVARGDSMCGSIIGQRRPVHVADASQDSRWARKPLVDGRWGTIRFYGGHPLVSPSGFVIGTLCVLDSRPRELAESQVAELAVLAERVVDELERWRRAADAA